MRPLDRIPSIKVKLGILIIAAIVVAVATSTVGYRLGWPIVIRPVLATVLSLGMVQWLAKGMTRPLREMERAATAMAKGDHSRRVSTSATDEVGRLAQAFNSMADELAVTERQRRELVANVSHELRTPVASLQASIENLLDGVTAADESTLLAMHAQTLRLGRLVRDLLDLSRLESGAAALEVAPTDLGAVARRVVDDVHLARPDATIRVDCPAPVEIEADPHRLHQVLTNLVDNAVRHGGGSEVSVTVSSLDDCTVRLSVIDGGSGIPADERERVFERFHRADPSRSDHRGGAGLGLSISRWIVDLHGGHIEATDAPGRGCEVRVDLPRRHDDTGADHR